MYRTLEVMNELGSEKSLIVSLAIKSEMTKIGVFDSGFGGLTVLKALLEAIPHADYLYFGDAMPNLRVKADWKHVTDGSTYEALVSIDDRHWSWKQGAAPPTPEAGRRTQDQA